ncbi:DNA mismatch repair endonuclease MutL [Paenibacillus sp. YIM B09110]|uniref:DNA mismatch repair endonuclease MutL n=1 Tax=Paenibacillus sp. YIM B09110 TaxID=3126102 RepID=UPI00301B7E85
MGKIKILDEQLANQIAAGEVVERPAAVIKELVENAIDAGSTTIDITIEEGGLTLMRVVDNGYGIEASDILTAFQRHATSKISTSSDLFKIASLGFRGEALPSIAAVSRLSCTSADTDTGLARQIVIEGGNITVNEPANAPQGTDMIVRDLFYNTPARLKYMKAIQTELGHISDYVNRIALAHPGVAFTFKHNGSTLLQTVGTGDRLQVIAAIYGTNTAKAMLAVEAESSDYELRGYVSKPELTRANRNGITAIVNGRYIRSHAINQALLQAYHTLLPINRYPLAVIELGMHPSLLDVNVHPSKMEVRFSKEAELRTLLEEAVRKVLGKQRYIPGPDAGKQERSKPLFVQDTISFHRTEEQVSTSLPSIAEIAASSQRETKSAYASPNRTETPAWPRPQSTAGSRPNSSPSAYSAPYAANADKEYVPPDATNRLYSPQNIDKQTNTIIREQTAPWPEPPPVVEASEPAIEQEQIESLKPAFPELHWIGQHHGTYIVAQAEDGLYLIDQHAAHERINYEYYYRKFGNPEAASQQLLVPLTLEFTPGEASQLREQLHLFAEAGVEVEPFGSQTFLVRSYPEWMPSGEEKAIIEEMAELLMAERKSIDIAKLREKAAIMCSCKASIKANDRMNREEGDALLSRLGECEQPYTCPHGRPIIVHLSTYQLEKMFKRVMS